MRLERLNTYRLIRVLRVVLPLIVVVLVAIPSWNYWIRLKSEPRDTSKPIQLPKDLSLRTENFSFTRSDKGRALFTIHARTNLAFTDNRNMLEDVDATWVRAKPEDEWRKEDKVKYPVENVKEIDPAATMAFLAQYRIRDQGDSKRKPAEAKALVVALPGGGDPLEAAKSHVIERIKKDFAGAPPEIKLTGVGCHSWRPTLLSSEPSCHPELLVIPSVARDLLSCNA